MKINLTMSQWNLLNSGRIVSSFKSLDVNNDNQLTHADAKAATNETLKNEILNLLNAKKEDEEVKIFDFEELEKMLEQAEKSNNTAWKKEIEQQKKELQNQEKLAELETKKDRAQQTGNTTWLKAIEDEIKKIINNNKLATLDNQLEENPTEDRENVIKITKRLTSYDVKIAELEGKLARANKKGDTEWAADIQKQIDEKKDKKRLDELRIQFKQAVQENNTERKAEIQEEMNEIKNKQELAKLNTKLQRAIALGKTDWKNKIQAQIDALENNTNEEA